MKNFLIAGLGNPGDKYKNNRHNIGFQIIDTYLTYFSQNKLIDKFDSEYASINFKENKLHIIKPKTFMNESGKAAVHHSTTTCATIGKDDARLIVDAKQVNDRVGVVRQGRVSRA